MWLYFAAYAKRRADPRGSAPRRADAGGARRADRARPLGDRPLGAGRRLAERRQPARIVRACGFDLPLELVPRRHAPRQGRSTRPRCSRRSGASARCSADARPRGADGSWLSTAEVRPARPAADARPAPRHLHRDRRLRPRHPGNRRDHARGRHRPLDAAREPAPPRRSPSRPRRPQADGRSSPSLEETPSATEPVLELTTDRGELKIVPQPAGTRGYDDLRRAATREPLGGRPPVGRLGRRPRPHALRPRARRGQLQAHGAAAARRARARPRTRAVERRSSRRLPRDVRQRTQPVGAT